MSDYERLTTLRRFIRGQALLTEGHPTKPGPGEVRLNHEEALLVADALDEHCQQLAAIENPRWSWRALAEFYRRHGILSKAMPMCFVCGGPSHWPPPKQHEELPNILVCERCLNARSEGLAHAEP